MAQEIRMNAFPVIEQASLIPCPLKMNVAPRLVVCTRARLLNEAAPCMKIMTADDRDDRLGPTSLRLSG
jgi:hypothetical protein